MQDLNELLPSGEGITITSATAINDSDPICRRRTGEQQQHPARLSATAVRSQPPDSNPEHAGKSAAETSANNGQPFPFVLGRTIYAQITPNTDTTLSSMAQACGFQGFDWQQLVTNLPCPQLLSPKLPANVPEANY